MQLWADSSAILIAGQCALAYLGIKSFIALAAVVWKRLFAPSLDIKQKYGGHWALVTGSTDGIGKAYAFALAKCNLNVILVSRTQSKLDSVAAEIVEKCPKVETKTISVDFVNDDETSYRLKIAREIEGIDVSVLINNVGMSYEMPATFLEMEGGTHEATSNLVKCNITSLNSMTAIILPQMVERKSGVIINVSSLSGLMPTPLLSVYSGTKAYVDMFSRGLTSEYKKFGITIQSVAPGYVVSKLSKMKRPSLMAPTPEVFVKSALGRLGVDSRTTGFWTHDVLLCLLTEVLPEWLATKITYDTLVGIRKRALKKKS